MTGTFEYERGDKRAVPDFNVFFRYFATYPYYSDAVWYLTQMRRWGQIAEQKPDEWYADDREVACIAPTCTSRPRAMLVAEGLREGSRTSRGRATAIARRQSSSSTASSTTAASRTPTSRASRSVCKARRHA